jgi:membrane protein YdbS with pleckstrin-like domain
MWKREFRPSWLVALGRPALITLLLSVPFVAWALLDFPRSIGLVLIAPLPLAWFYSRYLAWRINSWTFDVQAKALVIRSGILNRHERRIPLNWPPQVSYSQGLVGRIFNFGTAEISSFGELVTFRHVGHFRAFKQVLTSPEQAPAETEPPFLTAILAALLMTLLALMKGGIVGLIWLACTLTQMLVRFVKWLFDRTWAGISVVAVELSHLARTSTPLFHRLLTWTRVQFQSFASADAESVKTTASIQEDQISAFHATWDGLLAFFVDLVLPFQGHQVLPQNYTQPDQRRTYYRTGISPEVAEFYLWALRQARIIVSGTNGRTGLVLCSRIKTVDDVMLRIPRRAFGGMVSRYSILSRLEGLAALRPQPGCTLRAIQGNNHDQLSKQPLAFPESRRGNGQRPAA